MEKYKIYTVLLFATVIILSGCGEDFLKEDENTFLSPGNTYTTEAGLETALIPIYRSVNTHYSNKAWVQAGTDVAQTNFNSRADNVALDIYNSQLNGELGAIRGWWSSTYESIDRANTIISYVDEAEFSSETNRRQISGEAHFFRAFWYFDAVQTWGDIPLVTEPASGPKTDYVRATKADIYAQIVSDLKVAIAGISPVSDEQGKLTRGAAQHLLSNVYLAIGEWENAEAMADTLIMEGPHSLVTSRFGIQASESGTPYSDIFLEGNENIEYGNPEVLWAIQFGDRINKDITRTNTVKFAWWPVYEKLPGLKLSNDNYQRGKWRVMMTPYWFTLFEPGDDRNSDFAIKRKWYYNDCEFIDQMMASGNPLIQWKNGIPLLVQCGDEVYLEPDDPLYLWIYPTPMKYVGILGTDPTESVTEKDIIMYRLAETYLFKAEAQFRQNKLAEAAETLNIIRRRSNASEITDLDVTLDFILDERARELGSEVNRWATLVRTGELLNRYRANRPDAAGNIQDYHVLMPIPQSEIDFNTASENFKQNPGYPGAE